MIEWIQNAKEWISDRVQERTSWDGAMLIGVGLVGLLFQDSGKIFLDDKQLSKASINLWRNKIIVINLAWGHFINLSQFHSLLFYGS